MGTEYIRQVNNRSKIDRNAKACVCDSGISAERCCVPFIKGIANAPSAQALMRSRYTAYVVANTSYLLRTWHPSTQPAQLRLDDDIRWLGLKLKNTSAGKPGDREGTVEFVARFKVGSRAQRIHENSRFVFDNNCWLYLDGEIKHQPDRRPGR